MHIFQRIERKKLDSKARKCVFLEYGTETKGYRLYDCERKGVFYSRDVKFNESEFGIEKEPCDGPDKLITIELSCDDDVIKDSEIPDVRRSTSWERRPPDRLGEWMTIASDDTDEPTTVREALSSSDSEQWRQAMQNKMKSLYEHNVWELTDLPEGAESYWKQMGFSKLNIKLMDQLKGQGQTCCSRFLPEIRRRL